MDRMETYSSPGIHGDGEAQIAKQFLLKKADQQNGLEGDIEFLTPPFWHHPNYTGRPGFETWKRNSPASVERWSRSCEKARMPRSGSTANSIHATMAVIK